MRVRSRAFVAAAVRAPDSRSRIWLAATAIIIIGAAGAFIAAERTSPPAMTAEEAGRAYLFAGNYQSAVATLRAAYRAHPSESLKLDLSRALLAAGDFESVIGMLGSDDSSAASDLRAQALFGAARFDDAAKAATASFESVSADSRAMLLLAKARYALGDASAASHWLGNALRARGEMLAESWCFRARLALDANDLPTARSAAERAAETGASPLQVFLIRAEILMRQGDFAGARGVLEKLAKPDKRSAQRYEFAREFLAARIDAARGSYIEAARRIRASGALYRSAPNGSAIAGMIAEGAGDAAQAETIFRAGLDAAPSNPVLLDAFAAFLVRQGRSNEALETVARLERVAPYLAQTRRAAILLENGDRDAALARIKSAADLTPAPFSAEIVFGPKSQAAIAEQAALGAARRLISAARTLLDADAGALRDSAKQIAVGRDPVALELAGELLLAAGEAEAAASRFDEAFAIAPDFDAARIGRLRADLASGRSGEAEARLFAAIARDPSDAFARLSLARLLRSNGRLLEAAAVLRPMAKRLTASAKDAGFYANILAAVGARDQLSAFADLAFAAKQGAPYVVDLYEKAGRLDQAGLAARAALLEAPGDEARAQRYLRLMEKAGRGDDARLFLSALAKRLPAASGARAALADAAGAPALRGGEAAKAAATAGAGDLRALERAYRAAPTDPRAALRLGLALQKAGREDKAARLLREACFWSSAATCAKSKGTDS
ncbi:MAG: tetratricopeptide repeat protein [Alphaproteobacteria bacterium]|nr:tetratricopeptide repeat protein [Alphaproteobacteria bacterium]